MMSRLNRLAMVIAVIGALCAAQATWADDWQTSVEGGADDAATINAKLAAGSGTGKIIIDDASTILVDTTDIINCTGVVASHASAAITFSANQTIIFADAAAEITINTGAALTITGAVAGAGFDFSTTAAGKTLTVTSAASGTLDSAVQANQILLGGGNTLNIVAGGTPAINAIVIADASTPTIDVDADATIASLADGGNDVTVDIADGVTCTLTTATLTGTTNLAGADTDSVLEIDAAITIADVDIATGETLTLDIDNDVVFTTLDTAGTADLTFDIITGKTATLTTATLSGAAHAVTGADATSTLTLHTSGGHTVGTISIDTCTLDVDANTTIGALSLAGDAAVDVAGGATLTATAPVDVNANTLTLSGTGVVSAIDFDTAAGEINVTGGGTVTTLTQQASATATLDVDVDVIITNDVDMAATMTVDVAGTKTITFTDNDGDDDGFNVGANELVLMGDGAIDEVTVDTASYTLDIDSANIDITSLNITAAGTIDLGTATAWTQTVDIAANNLTVSGTGSISDLDAAVTGATVTLTASTSASVTIVDFDPGFDAAGDGILQFSGAGNWTVTALTDLPEDDDKIQKLGTGSLTLTPGITTSFANGAGVLLDIDAGTVVIGVAGTNDNITFDDDADEITVASGATLTTYGSFAVGAAGANVNLDAAAGSTVNLSSAAGPETITALADNDYNLLGTVNIAGANSDYVISDAFDYKFGDVNINNTGSLTNNNGGSDMLFVPSSTVELTGSGTLDLDGGGTFITLDTTTGAGEFTINRNASPNLLMSWVSVANCVYESDYGGQAICELSLDSMEFLDGNTDWNGSCTGGSNVVVVDDTDETTDGDTTDGTGDETTDSVTDTVDEDGSVETSNDSVTVVADGLNAGEEVTLSTDADGQSTLNVVDGEGVTQHTIIVDGLGDGGDIDFAVNPDGSQSLTFASMGATVLTVNATGLGEGSTIDVTLGADNARTLVLSDGTGRNLSFTLNDLPDGAGIDVITDDAGGLSLMLTNDAGLPNLLIETDGLSATGSIVFNYNTDETAGRIIASFPGFEDDEAVGGSFTVSATGLESGAVVLVAASYEQVDLGEVDEGDLRLFRLNDSTGQYESPGPSDKGDSEPTGVAGDYGVDTGAGEVWAEVTTLGTFAIGVPAQQDDDIVDETIDDDDDDSVTGPACGAGAGCGAMGAASWFALMAGLSAMRRRRRT